MTAAFTWTVASVTSETLEERSYILVQAQADAPAVLMPPEAVGDRMVAYQLAAPQGAFEAILREHGCRINGLAFDPTDTTTIAISYATGADTERDNELAAYATEIQNAIDAKTGVATTPAAGQASLPPAVSPGDVAAAAAAAAGAAVQAANPSASQTEIAAVQQAAQQAATAALPH